MQLFYITRGCGLPLSCGCPWAVVAPWLCGTLGCVGLLWCNGKRADVLDNKSFDSEFQDNGRHAIWFQNEESCWAIGFLKDLGSKTVGIVSSKEVVANLYKDHSHPQNCPNKADFEMWFYWNGNQSSWERGNSDITVLHFLGLCDDLTSEVTEA